MGTAGRSWAWLALVVAAGVTALIGWNTYGRAERAFADDGADAALAAVSEGFWILFGLFAAAGVGRMAWRHIHKVLGRAPEGVSLVHLGQYTLEEKLGEGAMGAVYRARHALLRRPTAIKLLRVERQDDRRAVRRFEREVQQTSRLMHPNTVAVYDYGRTAEGVFYYVMEFIEGVTLERLGTEWGALLAARAIYILKQVCGSLAEAHEIGLVHRDIKPANIMLCEQGGEHDVVKVLDFGLVKELGDPTESLTGAEALAGTPLYASPEAIRSHELVEPRSDIYSLGAVGYFLVTGAHVFEGETVTDVCSKHLSEEPVPPSQRINRHVPPDLEKLILACLAKDPADRPNDARELRDALVACADHANWGQAEARAWWTDHRAALRAAGTVARRQLEQAMLTMTIDLESRR